MTTHPRNPWRVAPEDRWKEPHAFSPAEEHEFCSWCGAPDFARCHGWWERLAGRIRYRLTERDPAHLAQYSEYDILLDGNKIGRVAGGANTAYSDHRGRRVVTERTWSAMTLDGRGTMDVPTRRDATRDLLLLLGLDEKA